MEKTDTGAAPTKQADPSPKLADPLNARPRAADSGNTVAVKLDTPIKRGDTTIAEVTLRRPKSGELRGLLLTEVIRMQVDALVALLPRISTPTLTRPEIDALDPADLMALGTEAIGFFLSREQLAASQADSLAA